MVISPPSGDYITTQAFDITLIVVAQNSASAVVKEVILDGVDFGMAFEACAMGGSLDAAPGTTFRCPLDAAKIGSGTHTFDVTVELSDGTTGTDSATWEIFQGNEP